MTVMLAVENITVRYGASTAVDGATFHVEEGEVVALMGRNGVGKTTTISAIAGMLRVVAGSIRLGDEDVTNWPSHRRATAAMALVAQGRRLFNGLTVQENLAVGESGSRRRTNREFGWTVKEMYERFPVLYDRRKVHAGLMSGGEQQMLAIARALVTCPRFLVLDEPSEGLAPLIVQQIGDIIREVKDRGGTVLLVEQNLGLGLDSSDRVYLMSKGRIVASGTPDEVSADHALMREYVGVG